MRKESKTRGIVIKIIRIIEKWRNSQLCAAIVISSQDEELEISGEVQVIMSNFINVGSTIDVFPPYLYLSSTRVLFAKNLKQSDTF